MKRRGVAVDGWIVLDKPVGIGSTPALAAVRRAANAQKAGHGGTLDPLASGILPIALGEATKTVQWVMDGTKRYRFTLRWGQATATEDSEGEITASSPVRPDAARIRDALDRFVGTVSQVPSRFSALRVDGRRAYDLARAGEAVDLAARAVRIDALDLIEQPDADHAIFEVVCGKGTYIRALGRDLAEALGTVAHVAALRRLSVGRFNEAHAISMESLAELGHSNGLSKHLLPIETALDDIPALALTEVEALHLRQGQAVRPICLLDRARSDLSDCGEIVSVTAGGKIVAVARLDAGMLRSMRILNV